MTSWIPIAPGLWRFPDSCNVYAAQGPEGLLIVDAGTGAWLAHRDTLPGPIVALACTHYFRDHSAGAAAAARTLRAWKPDILLPSLGEPMTGGADDALAALQTNLKRLVAPRPGSQDAFALLDREPLTKVTDHVWLDNDSVANTWYLISDSGKALAIDYGYALRTCAGWPGYPKPERRRALLHGLDALKARFGIDRIDVVLVSHFHDDHVCGIPVLQRLHGTQCWAAENFADLLAFPEAHCFPCNWPVPARIYRRLALDTPFTWEEYTFTLSPMSGHTRFAALIGFEADGRRFAHTGDQYFFDGHENFADRQRAQNHVYRNGALLTGYAQSGAWMQQWRPEIVLQGHQPAFVTDDAFFVHIDAWNDDYAALHKDLMPLGENEPHFDLDSWGGWLWPYRTRLDAPGPFELTATVRNPRPRAATLTLRPVLPPGWRGESVTLSADARAEVSGRLTLTADAACRRQPIAIELLVDGQTYGQVAEALVTTGHEEF